jgi:2-oxoglutarate ferredoxin oxidoreductase subunit alpha
MVRLRAEKIERIADYIPLQEVDNGNTTGKVAIVGWGGTYGSLKAAVKECREEGLDVSHIHVKYINPFPKNLGELLKGFEKVIVPEINRGQLVSLLRDKYLVPAVGYNKVQGSPFSVGELKERIKKEF